MTDRPDNPPAKDMSLRDHAAFQVLHGMCSNPNMRPDMRPSEMASECYRLADAMLAARGRSNG